jgi:hypothetical protein
MRISDEIGDLRVSSHGSFQQSQSAASFGKQQRLAFLLPIWYTIHLGSKTEGSRAMELTFFYPRSQQALFTNREYYLGLLDLGRESLVGGSPHHLAFLLMSPLLLPHDCEHCVNRFDWRP